MSVRPAGITVVVTEYGEYFPTAQEIAWYRQVYGDERVRCFGYGGEFTEAKWQAELLHYATEQTEKAWRARA